MEKASEKYCALCQKLYMGDKKCPNCLFSKLRAPQPNDPVLLDTVDYMKAELLKGLLTDAEIPFSYTGGVGGAFGMGIGFHLDAIRIYVPYGAYDEAKAICAVVSRECAGDESSKNDTES